MINYEEQRPGETSPAMWRLEERRGRQIPTIHVPLDGSIEATKALPVAFELARLTKAAIHVVHVGPSPIPAEDLPSHLHLQMEQMRGSTVDQRAGKPVEAITQVALEHNSLMIAMTTHGGTPQPTIVGHVAAGIARQASCPVLFVLPEGKVRLPIRHILLPLDGSPSAAAAVSPAVDLAHRAGADLEVLHVASTRGKIPQEPGSLTTPRYVDQPQHEWPSWAYEFLDRFSHCLGECPYTVPTRLFLARGQPGSEIIQFAMDREIDLIVLERRGSFDRKHANLITAVLRRAPCPVLLLHKQIRPYLFGDREHTDLAQSPFHA